MNYVFRTLVLLINIPPAPSDELPCADASKSVMTLLIVLFSLIADAARLINQPRMSRRALPIHQDGAHAYATLETL